jgi:hypothetical protein
MATIRARKQADGTTRYTASETISRWQRSKQAHLEFLERHDIGKANALNLTAAALIDHVGKADLPVGAPRLDRSNPSKGATGAPTSE